MDGGGTRFDLIHERLVTCIVLRDAPRLLLPLVRALVEWAAQARPHLSRLNQHKHAARGWDHGFMDCRWTPNGREDVAFISARARRFSA